MTQIKSPLPLAGLAMPNPAGGINPAEPGSKNKHGTNRRKPLPIIPVRATINSLTHDGRGVAHIDGKAVFIDAALPGEEVEFLYTEIRRDYAEGKVVNVLKPPNIGLSRFVRTLMCAAVAAFSMWIRPRKSKSNRVCWKNNLNASAN